MEGGRKSGSKEDKMVEDEVWEARSTSRKPRAPRKSRSRSKHRTRDTPSADDKEPIDSALAATAPLPTPSPTPMPAVRPLPLLICSIGNPGPSYANTLHSAGHTVLNRLAQHLGYPKFQKDRSLGNGLVSSNPHPGPDWTLWQSTSYMNESGKGVRAAWHAWSKDRPDGEARLVVLHDELEKPLGAVSVKTTRGASAKGHNGLKSIMGTMGGGPFARIGVGIGRPESRASEDVAGYVLKKMTAGERARVEGGVEEVVALLQVLEKG